MPDPAAGRRRPATQSHRLHGLEGPRQRARPVAHFPPAGQGPRLDNYLAQLKNAEKLDFASWGGFAQNFAGRRIPFENAAYSAYWNRAAGDSLHIPTFAAGASRALSPGHGASKARCAPAWCSPIGAMACCRMLPTASRASGLPRRPAESWKSRRSDRRAPIACASWARAIPRRSPIPVQGLPAAHIHAAAARRRLRARMEAEPARHGGWRAPRGQHAHVCRNGRAGHFIHGRLEREEFIPAAGGPAIHS